MASRRMKLAAAGAGMGLAAWQLSRRARTAPQPLPEGPRHRVVILGGGFGGISVLDELHRRLGTQTRLDVLLIDRNNFNLFTPMLYQSATGLVDPDNLTYPLRAHTRVKGARFQESVVQGVDANARMVITDDGAIPYDTLIVSLGSVTNFFGMEDVASQSLTLKTVGDAITLRNRIIDAFEQADVTTDEKRRRELLNFTVAGAGATGVELAASIDNLVRTVLLRDYPNVRHEEVTIRLVEAKGRAVPEMSAEVGRLTTERLHDRGIQLLLNSPVVGTDGNRLRLGNGSILAPATVVWTAGVRSNPVTATLPVEPGRGGRIPVNEFLQLEGHPEILCIGDNTLATDPMTGQVAPPNAPAAIQMGKLVAANLERQLRGMPMQPFHYRFKGELLSLGRNAAVVHYAGMLFDGFPAWVLWRTFYIGQLMGWENRVGVLGDWAFAYFAKRRESSRLVCQPARIQEQEEERVGTATGAWRQPW